MLLQCVCSWMMCVSIRAKLRAHQSNRVSVMDQISLSVKKELLAIVVSELNLVLGGYYNHVYPNTKKNKNIFFSGIFQQKFVHVGQIRSFLFFILFYFFGRDE